MQHLKLEIYCNDFIIMSIFPCTVKMLVFVQCCMCSRCLVYLLEEQVSEWNHHCYQNSLSVVLHSCVMVRWKDLKNTPIHPEKKHLLCVLINLQGNIFAATWGSYYCFTLKYILISQSQFIMSTWDEINITNTIKASLKQIMCKVLGWPKRPYFFFQK